MALVFSEPLNAILPSRHRFQMFVRGVCNVARADATRIISGP
jgi:hypothetical protein